MTADPALTPWQALPDGAGTVLAVAGDVRVAAQSGRLRAWRGLDPLWSVEVGEPNPARPTVLADRVLWGPYAVDLDTGSVTDVPFARPPAGYAQTAHAWSADGSLAVAAGRRRDRGGSAPPAAAWLLGDPVPRHAVVRGRRAAARGVRRSRRWSRSGTAIRISTPRTERCSGRWTG